MKESTKRTLLWLLPTLAGVLLTLYPYLLTRVPYGTDQWGELRNANEILARSPVALGVAPQFDSYNIFWPGVSMLEVVFSLTLHTIPINSIPLVVATSSFLTTTAFYLIVEKLSKSSTAASISSLLLVSASFYIISGASASKQTLAFSFFMFGIFLAIFNSKFDWRTFLLFGITSLALAITHHVTMFILLSVLLSIGIVYAALRIRFSEFRTSNPTSLVLISASVTLVYFAVYASTGWYGLKLPIDAGTVMTALSFGAVAIAPVVYYSLSRPRRLVPVEEMIILVGGIAVFLIGTETHVIPLAPVLPSVIIIFAIPYFVVGFLSLLGHRIMQARMSRSNFAFIASWVGAIVGLEGFAIFSGITGSVVFVYRLFIFLYPGLAALAGIALASIFLLRKNGGNLLKPLIALVVLVIAGFGVYTSYSGVVGGNNILGGHWSYQSSDMSGESWTSAHIASGVLSGDTTIFYLFNNYGQINMSSSSLGVYAYLAGLTSSGKPKLLATYSLMSQDGFVTSTGYGLPLPGNWYGKLENSTSVVYSNGNIVLWNSA